MPIIKTCENITDIAYTGASANAWDVYVYTGAQGTDDSLGSLRNGGAYVDGSEIPAPKVFRIVFDDTNDDLDIIADEVLTVEGEENDAGFSFAITLPAIKANVSYYVCSNGYIFEDVALEIPAYMAGVNNEEVGLVEAHETQTKEDYGETAEEVAVTETHEGDENYGETSETVDIAEAHATLTYGETSEAVTLTEEHTVERGSTEETVYVTDYIIGVNEDLSTLGRIITDQFDMGLRAIKLISVIEIGCKDRSDITIAVDYKFKEEDDWTRTTAKPLNVEGWARIQAAGTQFRVVIISTDFTTLDIDRITVRWQLLDKRGIRGAYANTPGA